ncbi:hypothetical protein ACNOYE_19930 [Nannocystaceae bacterium ST9]
MTTKRRAAFVAVLRRHPEHALRLARLGGVGIEAEASDDRWREVDGRFADPSGSSEWFQAGLALAAFDPGGEALQCLILEPLFAKEPRRPIIWYSLRIGLFARHRVGTPVLVLVPNPAVEQWVRGEFENDTKMLPNLIGRDAMPAIVDEAEAAGDPGWATLSAAMHAQGPHAVATARAALRAAASLPDDRRREYAELIWLGLIRADKDQVRDEMPSPRT